MWGRVATGLVKSKHASLSQLTKNSLQIWRMGVPLASIVNTVGPSFYQSFSTVNKQEAGNKRNIAGFQPLLSDFMAQYALTSDKLTILQKLEKNSEKHGFSVLAQAVNNVLLENNEMNQVNLYSMLVIASIQVKDDTLLSYVLSDAYRYIPTDCNTVYEVLKRICHYRKYSHFITFLQNYFSDYPEASQYKELCEMGLYLASKDSNDNRAFAVTMWEQLNTLPVSTEEERNQRSTDLSHLLNVFSSQGDWTSCSLFVRSPYCTISHISKLLRSMIQSAAKPGFIVLSYLDFRDVIYQTVNDTTIKDILFVADLMLDVYKLSKDGNLLNVLVEDLTTLPESSIPEVLYSRLCKLCIQNKLTDPLFKLYCFNEGRYSEKVYRSIEKYFHKLEGNSHVYEMKKKVFECHYSNTVFERESLELDDDDFIENDVLQILQSDYQIKRKPKEKKTRKEFTKKNYRKRSFSLNVY